MQVLEFLPLVVVGSKLVLMCSTETFYRILVGENEHQFLCL